MATANRKGVDTWKPLPLGLIPAELKRKHFDPMHAANMDAFKHKAEFDAALTVALREVGAITKDEVVVTARPKWGVKADGTGYTYGIAPVSKASKEAAETAQDDTFAALKKAPRGGKGR